MEDTQNANGTEPELPSDFGTAVAQYVLLRDGLKGADDDHKKKTAGAREYMKRLEGFFLENLNASGSESVRTAAGTVYRTTRRSATVADADVFRKYVAENEAFDLVDFRANAPAVDEYISENGAPPPGVNFQLSITVGVRRA